VRETDQRSPHMTLHIGGGVGGDLSDTDADRIVAEILATPGASITRRPFAYASSSRVDALDVVSHGGRTTRLLAKHLGRGAMTEAARRAKPESLHCAERELAVYRYLLPGTGLGTPALIGGWSSDGGDAVLVLERVEGTPLTEIGDFAVWEAAARWLAHMHGTFRAAPQLPVSVQMQRRVLLNYDRELLDASARRGLERALAEAHGSAEICVALRDRHEDALRTLTSAPVTLVHGDFYPSNIIVAGDRIAVVDWELAGVGPGPLDLAALLSGSWSNAHRRALIEAYDDEARWTRQAETLTVLAAHAELASLQLALRWLGASPDWAAPDEHRRDWFADALSALRRFDGHEP
jgi:aminoglycoside phosphotransferase (APT) family kinase protein